MNDYTRVEKAIRYLKDRYLDQPDLRTVAEVAGMSEFHFQRLFSRWAGISPKAMLQLLTAQRAKALLRESRSSVLDAALDAGLSGPGRLHDLMVTVEAVSPGEFKSYGAGVDIGYGFHATPFGVCMIGATARGVCRISFLHQDDRKTRAALLDEFQCAWPRANFRHDQPATARLAHRIFGRGAAREPLRVLLVGTSFRLKVWQALLEIPFGRVASYRDVAESVGAPDACRAVGSAVGANPVAYLIPCHRVIRETGVIGEYRWGAERKIAMLVWENGASCAIKNRPQDAAASASKALSR
ncbi:MAG TPA: methylated-DNA--[protein]-cysteine S-methyltransferase [Candidatus Binatia bacterium]|jgi:AraC family transcriptional regulator of adaptative response/methylated-DNA-[protein]-cysteine methyltransferase